MLRSDFQYLIGKVVAKIVKNEIAPSAKMGDENREYSEKNMKIFGDLRLLSLRIPIKYGGLGRGLLDSALVLKEVAKADASTAINLHIQHNATPLYIVLHGSEEIKKKFLVPLVEGWKLFSMAQTEPDVGSNLNEIKTTARPSGDHYIVNGAKCMITLGRNADVHLVYLRFEDDDSLGCLLIEKGTEGFFQGGHEDFMGLRGLNSGELAFKDCQVPKENVLIKGPNSLQKLLTPFNGTRVGLSAISLGIAEAAFEEAVRYSKVRFVSGKPLVEYQGIQWKLADMALKLESMRHLILSAAKDTSTDGFPSPYISSVCKIVAVEGSINITNMAMDIFGGYGYSKEYPIERYLREARGTSFIGGTPEVMRNTIGGYLKRKKI